MKPTTKKTGLDEIRKSSFSGPIANCLFDVTFALEKLLRSIHSLTRTDEKRE